MIIPVNVPDTTKTVRVYVEYKGSLGTDLIRVTELNGEELEKYRRESECVTK